MAWSWSHTADAYAFAQEQVRAQEREWLEVVFAEWRAAQEKRGVINSVHAAFSERKYQRAMAFAKTLDDETLADFIWERMEEQATCTNGGWEAWCCPYGCHLVPFGPEEEDES